MGALQLFISNMLQVESQDKNFNKILVSNICCMLKDIRFIFIKFTIKDVIQESMKTLYTMEVQSSKESTMGDHVESLQGKPASKLAL